MSRHFQGAFQSIRGALGTVMGDLSGSNVGRLVSNWQASTAPSGESELPLQEILPPPSTHLPPCTREVPAARRPPDPSFTFRHWQVCGL